jgi:hypothetical protein
MLANIQVSVEIQVFAVLFFIKKAASLTVCQLPRDFQAHLQATETFGTTSPLHSEGNHLVLGLPCKVPYSLLSGITFCLFFKSKKEGRAVPRLFGKQFAKHFDGYSMRLNMVPHSHRPPKIKYV